MVGGKPSDQVGVLGIGVLTNNNYIIQSPAWDYGGLMDVGTATWADGNAATTGIVSITNSLRCASAGDSFGDEVIPLLNGNYVLSTISWDNGSIVDAGSVTPGSGAGGITGTINSINSLVGTKASDRVGGAVFELSNSNYAIKSHNWDNGAVVDVGAVTWGNGTTGITGTINAGNSLVGTRAFDRVGSGALKVLADGNLVVGSHKWRNGQATNAGAATWVNGSVSLTGAVTATNSLVGSTLNDEVGFYNIVALPGGDYMIFNTLWDNGVTTNSGAVTFGTRNIGVTGTISGCNSVIGDAANGSITLAYTHNPVRDYIIVGRPSTI